MIYITGDLHGEITRLSKLSLTADDTLIVCGDFGFACHVPAENDFGLAWLARQPYTVLFIDGNHDNHDWLDAMPAEELYGGTVHRVRDNVFHLMRGQVYTIDGKKIFTMGGAYSIDKSMRIEGESWWKEELPTNEEYREATRNLKAHDFKVDYILTHTMPREMIVTRLFKIPDHHDAELTGFLDWINDTVEYQRWFCGHWHEDREITDKIRALYYDVVTVS
jgi:Icc-related predicted phosphoesterase